MMKSIILAGGGHGHIDILRKMKEGMSQKYKIRLISDYPRQYYSGMLPGYLEGLYTAEDISFDIASLCQKAGVEFINDSILEINDRDKTVKTKSQTFSYNFISLNLGSQAIEAFDINPETTTYCKPIQAVIDFHKRLAKELAQRTDQAKLLIVGGGAAGTELALAYRAAFPHLSIDLVTADHTLVKNFNSWSQWMTRRLFKKKGIGLYFNERLKAVEDSVIVTDRGRHSFDYLILSTGTRGPKVSYVGLATDKNNYLLVDDHLMASDTVIAMGDMATLTSHPQTPKAGVFAIRQAPVLSHNFLQMIEAGDAKTLKIFKPRQLYMQILNAGGKQAILNYGPLSIHSKWAWKLKHNQDQSYMDGSLLLI